MLYHWLSHRQLYGRATTREGARERRSFLFFLIPEVASFQHDFKETVADHTPYFHQPTSEPRAAETEERCARNNVDTLSGHRERTGACNRETRTGGGGGTT